MTINKKLAVTFLVLSILGFLDATYLTIEHFLGNIPPCAIVNGCETVLTSSWSEVAGIPVALFGAIFYLFLGISTIVFLKYKKEQAMVVASWTTLLGLAATVWFMFLQIFILKAMCFYCTISAIISAALFGIGLAIVLAIRRARNNVLEKLP
jgi:uncharacterized membrane protein